MRRILSALTVLWIGGTAMTNPVITMRPDPDLVRAAHAAGINLRELLEQAIKAKINNCPMCGQKLKQRVK